MSTAPIVSVKNLKVTYHTNKREIRAVSDVDIDVTEGEVLGIVGESGSGKSTLGLALMGLLPQSAEIEGSVRVAETEVVGAAPKALRRIRGKTVGLVYQDALAALNPVRRVGAQVAEIMTYHLGLSRSAAQAATIEALTRVGISDAEQRARQFPHEFSGGMRQRAAIAMALAGQPRLLLADEPTTALDVTVQAQILRLLRDLHRSQGMSMIVISHDLEVIREVSSRVAVMYHGRIVETGATAEVMTNPAHPYTRELIRSAPSVETPEIAFIPGTPPAPGTWFSGCAFEPRCPVGNGNATCRQTLPLLTPTGTSPPRQTAACHFPITARPRAVPSENPQGANFQTEGLSE